MARNKAIFDAVINYYDLLFISYSIDSKNVKQIADFYDIYLTLFEAGRIPKILLDKSGCLMDFPNTMAKCSDKFSKNSQLADFIKLLLNN